MMSVFRNVFGVIVGYLVFAVSAVLLFSLAGIDPHAAAGLGTQAGIIAFGAFFAFAGGYIGKLIAAARSIIPNLVLALIMAGFAGFSFFKSPGEHYTQLAAIFLFAPMSLLGGILRRRSEAH